jgi:hypothetical protein
MRVKELLMNVIEFYKIHGDVEIVDVNLTEKFTNEDEITIDAGPLYNDWDNPKPDPLLNFDREDFQRLKALERR